MGKIFGTINLSNGVLTGPDVLGETFEISFGKGNGRISFPKLPDNFFEMDEWNCFTRSLYPPDGWFEKNVRDKEWGEIYCSNGFSYVGCIGFFLEFNDNATVGSDDVINCYKELIDNWRHLFIASLEATTRQHLIRGRERDNNRFHLFYQNSEEQKIRSFTNVMSIQVPDFTKLENIVLQKKQVEAVIELSCCGKELNLEHRLLNDARMSFAYNDYRKAIIDASAVIEIVLTKKIENELGKYGIAFKNKLLKKFKMLGGKFELIDILGIELPKFNKADVLEPRNKVAHAGFFPSSKEARTILDIAESLTELFSPSLT